MGVRFTHILPNIKYQSLAVNGAIECSIVTSSPLIKIAKSHLSNGFKSPRYSSSFTTESTIHIEPVISFEISTRTTDWTGEFYASTVYLYGPTVDITKPNVQATAIVETVEKDVYEDHVANANSRSKTKKFDNSLIFNGDDGYTYFITDLGEAYILINTPERTHIETVLNTITFKTP